MGGGEAGTSPSNESRVSVIQLPPPQTAGNMEGGADPTLWCTGTQVAVHCQPGEQACSTSVRHATIRKVQGRALAAQLSEATADGNPLLPDEGAPAGLHALSSIEAPAASPSARTPLQPLAVNLAQSPEQQQLLSGSKSAMHDASPGGNSQQTAYASAWTGSQQQPPLRSTQSPTRRRRCSTSTLPSTAATQPPGLAAEQVGWDAPGGRHSMNHSGVADVASSAAVSELRSDAAAMQAGAGVPGREDTLMVCNPLFGNADGSRSSALQRVAVAESLPLQPPPANMPGSLPQTGQDMSPGKPNDSGRKHAAAPAQEIGAEGLSSDSAGAMPVGGVVPRERGGSSFWGIAGDASAMEEVSLVSSPRASTVLEHGKAEASVAGRAAGHPAEPTCGGSDAAPLLAEGVLPEALSLTAAASDNPWAGLAVAPDQASSAGGAPQRQRGRLVAQQPEQAPVPSSCASNRPFFPPASRYGGAVDSAAARARSSASASAQPRKAQGASGELDQQLRVRETVQPGGGAEPVQAAGETSAGTRTGTVVVKGQEAAVGAEARAAWEALRLVPREGGAAQGRLSSAEPLQRDAPRAAAQPSVLEQLPMRQKQANTGGAGTPSDEALLRRLVSARQGPLAASSTAVLRASLHSAPDQAPDREAPPLTSRSDPAHRREPSTMAFLRHSGIFPAQGPLGASHGLLLRTAPPQPLAPDEAPPQTAGQAGVQAHALGCDASGQNMLQRQAAALPAAAPAVEPDQAERARHDAVQLPGACAPPASRPRLCPPPQHLRTPSLMQRAGELSPPRRLCYT